MHSNFFLKKSKILGENRLLVMRDLANGNTTGAWITVDVLRKCTLVWSIEIGIDKLENFLYNLLGWEFDSLLLF